MPRLRSSRPYWLFRRSTRNDGSGLSGHPTASSAASSRSSPNRCPTRRPRSSATSSSATSACSREFNHYRLFADILEDATGEPVRLEKLRGWQLPEDAKLCACASPPARTGTHREAAIGFTEGGGASFFYEGRRIGGDPISDQIAAACAIVFGDETEHGEHGASAFAHSLHTEEEWAEARGIVIAICQQRLRMRYEMFGLTVDEARITEITEGNIAPLNVYAG